MGLPGENQAAITATLHDLSLGNAEAADRLLPVVYQELRRLAGSYLRKERDGHTLQPTALAHEAFLRIIGNGNVPWQDRAHFLGIAAQAMRRILVEYARRRKAVKRGGNPAMVTLNEGMIADGSRSVAFDDLDRALKDLARLNERPARVIELRFFGGLSIEETAEVLGVAPMTVKRDWAIARAWLFREMGGVGEATP
ncbi:MAG: ECF subfamily RNA polymerase sigma-24 factor [bacterium]|nr:MAG: ECF subfamily RNA polymerase sigma-24 factor [bacterium]